MSGTEGHRSVQLMAQLDHFAFAYQLDGPQNGGGPHVVRRPTLVTGAPFGRTAIFFGRRTPGLRVGCGSDAQKRQ